MFNMPKNLQKTAIFLVFRVVNLPQFYLFCGLKVLKICHTTITRIEAIIHIVSGLSQRKDHEPSLINKDLLRFSSINPPSTKAKIKGGIGKS